MMSDVTCVLFAVEKLLDRRDLQIIFQVVLHRSGLLDRHVSSCKWHVRSC